MNRVLGFALGALASILFLSDRAGENLFLGIVLVSVLTAAATIAISWARTVRRSARELGAGVLGASLLGVLAIAASPSEARPRTAVAVLGILCVGLLARESARLTDNILCARTESGITQRAYRAIRLCLSSLLAYLLWQYLVSLAGPLPKISLKLFARELVAYTGVFYLVILLSNRASGFGQQVVRGIVGSLAIACVVMLGITALYGIGMLSSSFAVEQKWIRIEPQGSGQTWRLQFPFEHHNRTGFFGMIQTFLLPALMLVGGFGSPAWAIASAVGGLLIVGASVTRGALAGAGVGVAAALCAAPPRARVRFAGTLSVVIIAGATFAIFSPSQRAHWKDAYRWLTGRHFAPTSLASRMAIQSTALEMIAERPLLGWGYGYSTFETSARRFFPAVASQVEGMSHPHNQWIEQAFAGGLPGVVLFSLFTFSRLIGLAFAVRRATSVANMRWAIALALWFGLELAIQAYGLTNTALRRNLGVACYAIWAGSVIFTLSTFACRQPKEVTV
ncbi:MAG: O-antigen ligase family protein [Candidatus Sumerlaeaceae bacterium]